MCTPGKFLQFAKLTKSHAKITGLDFVVALLQFCIVALLHCGLGLGSGLDLGIGLGSGLDLGLCFGIGLGSGLG